MRHFQSQALPSTVIPSGIDLIDHDGRWALAATSTPSLALVGSRDILTPVRQARRIAQLLPNGRLDVIPLAGHQLMQERPREVIALIDEFAIFLSTRSECKDDGLRRGEACQGSSSKCDAWRGRTTEKSR